MINSFHHFSINNTPVELYFSPTDGTAQRITAAIDAAESELAFAILVFTENALGTAVKNAYDRGVTTQGIIDYVEFNGSEYDYLLDNNIDNRRKPISNQQKRLEESTNDLSANQAVLAKANKNYESAKTKVERTNEWLKTNAIFANLKDELDFLGPGFYDLKYNSINKKVQSF